MRTWPRGRAAFAIAAAAGLVHAGFSAYWALGGRWLLDTVGQWAVRLAVEAPVGAGLVLGLVAILKAAGAAVPIMVEQGRLGGRRFWRVLEWVGAVGLLLYGLVNVVVAWGVLTGVIATPGGFDRRAQLGHAALWDPLFLIWGVSLVIGLSLSRSPSRKEAPPG